MIERAWSAELRKVRDDPNEGGYVVSFSAAADKLSQWRAYSGSGTGYALGFRREALACHAGKEFSWVRCEYVEASQESLLVDAAIAWYDWQKPSADAYDSPDDRKYAEWMIGVGCVTTIARELATAIKHRKFSEEEEWRLVSRSFAASRGFRESRFGLVPFLELPLPPPEDRLGLERIVIGPTVDPVGARFAFRCSIRSA
jgi:hypothetical protein